MPLPIFLPCKKAIFILITLFLFGKKREKTMNLAKIQKKKVCSTSVLVYGRFNYWILSVRAVVTID